MESLLKRFYALFTCKKFVCYKVILVDTCLLNLLFFRNKPISKYLLLFINLAEIKKKEMSRVAKILFHCISSGLNAFSE